MDNIKIQLKGSGSVLTVGELTNNQVNYIISHQNDCGKSIPFINDDFTVIYKNWKDVNDICNISGASYEGSSVISLTVNEETKAISKFREERNFLEINQSGNYILSISHTQNILTFEFTVENFDENKLTFLVKDLNDLLWGELIYGIKYDDIIMNITFSEHTEDEFENIIYKNNTVFPIQKS